MIYLFLVIYSCTLLPSLVYIVCVYINYRFYISNLLRMLCNIIALGLQKVKMGFLIKGHLFHNLKPPFSQTTDSNHFSLRVSVNWEKNYVIHRAQCFVLMIFLTALKILSMTLPCRNFFYFIFYFFTIFLVVNIFCI